MSVMLGKITGKNTPSAFNFKVEGNPKKFDFVQVFHRDHDNVLAQIVNLTRDEEKTLAKCVVLGYQDEHGRMKPLRTPFEPNAIVFKAQDDFIRSMIQIESNEGAFLGRLDGKMIPVHLDLRQLLTKHVAILAKSGAGKSYTVGVLLEEIIERRVPLLIIDPHGEYSHLKYPNDTDLEVLNKYGIKPTNFLKQVREYSIGGDARQIQLKNDITGPELVHLLPAKLSNSQMTLLYTALQQLDEVNFETLMSALEMQESNSKWNLISIIDHLRKLQLFTDTGTSLNELIQPGMCSVLNFRGVPPEIQEIIVYKLMKDLFEARKKGSIPPFFAVIEEAHNYCPERSFGEAKSSKIIRTIASEGRKFGLGLCVVSQRPARVDKSVLSQLTTQLILKVTNPNDLKALASSVEGLTQEAQDEIKNLPIGTALVTGVVDLPLFVNVRPRKTKHGGHAVDILEEIDQDKFFEGVHEFEEKDLLPIIKPKITKKDLRMMAERPVKDINTFLIPAVKVICEWRGQEFALLIELMKGAIVRNVDQQQTTIVPNLNGLSKDELMVLEAALHQKKLDLAALEAASPVSTIKTSLGTLKRKGFFKKEDKGYSLNENLQLLTQPKHFASYSKIEFCSVQYDKKLEAKLMIEEVKNRLNRFVNVKDHKECFVVFYDVKLEKEKKKAVKKKAKKKVKVVA